MNNGDRRFWQLAQTRLQTCMVGRMVQYAAELRRQFAHAVQIITRTRALAGTMQHHNPNDASPAHCSRAWSDSATVI